MIELRCSTITREQRLVCSTDTHHSKTKHIISLWHHLIRDHCASDKSNYNMFTNEMPADILTKGLSGQKHMQYQDGLGMIIHE